MKEKSLYSASALAILLLICFAFLLGWGSGGLGEGLEDYYVFNGGTSMATPLTAGGAALVRQYYVGNEGISPSAALIKATLINGAKDIEGQYAEDEIVDQPRPNEAEGWRRVRI